LRRRSWSGWLGWWGWCYWCDWCGGSGFNRDGGEGGDRRAGLLLSCSGFSCRRGGAPLLARFQLEAGFRRGLAGFELSRLQRQLFLPLHGGSSLGIAEQLESGICSGVTGLVATDKFARRILDLEVLDDRLDPRHLGLKSGSVCRGSARSRDVRRRDRRRH
jgi:hypothetical protein